MGYLDKKGDMEYGILVSLLVLAAVLVMFVIFSYSFGGWLGETNQDQICKMSIFAAAQTKRVPTITGRGEPLTPLKCARKEILIKKSDVVDGGKINQDKAGKIIADEMYKCWDKVGAGKIDPFSQWSNKGESYCLICGYVKFDQALIDFMKENGDDKGAYIHSPIDYLANKKVPNSDITYYEYFYKQKLPPLSKEKLTELGNTGILPNSLILLQMYKKEDRTSKVGLIITGLLIGLVVVAGIATLGVAWGVIGTVTVIATKIAVIGMVIGAVINVGDQAFSDCPDCNAIGGIQLVPPTAELNMKVTVDIDGKKEQIPFCTRIVN